MSDNEEATEEQYGPGELTPADSGWSYDREADEVYINPTQADRRVVPGDVFFEANSSVGRPQ
jgi:hypothetical protein